MRAKSTLKQTMIIIGHDAMRSGAPLLLLRTCRFFAKSGYQVHVLLRKGGPLVEEFARCGPTYIWEWTPGRNSLVGRAARRLIEGSSARKSWIVRRLLAANPSVIVNNTVTNGEILEAFKGSGIPVVSLVHEMATMQSLWRTSTDATVESSTHLIAMSNAVSRDLKAKYRIDEGRVSVVHGGVDFVDRPRPDDRGKRFVVLSSGIMGPMKGIDLFVQVARTCRSIVGSDEILFQWCGRTGSLEQRILVEEDIRKLDLSGCMDLLGELEDPFEAFARASVFLLPSREDSFPLVMLEAAQLGLPIVAFRGSGGAEEFVDSSMGRLVPYLDVDAMAGAIIELYRDRNRARALGEGAKAKGIGFTSDATGRQVLEIVNRFKRELSI